MYQASWQTTQYFVHSLIVLNKKVGKHVGGERIFMGDSRGFFLYRVGRTACGKRRMIELWFCDLEEFMDFRENHGVFSEVISFWGKKDMDRDLFFFVKWWKQYSQAITEPSYKKRPRHPASNSDRNMLVMTRKHHMPNTVTPTVSWFNFSAPFFLKRCTVFF